MRASSWSTLAVRLGVWPAPAQAQARCAWGPGLPLLGPQHLGSCRVLGLHHPSLPSLHCLPCPPPAPLSLISGRCHGNGEPRSWQPKEPLRGVPS